MTAPSYTSFLPNYVSAWSVCSLGSVCPKMVMKGPSLGGKRSDSLASRPITTSSINSDSYRGVLMGIEDCLGGIPPLDPFIGQGSSGGKKWTLWNKMQSPTLSPPQDERVLCARSDENDSVFLLQRESAGAIKIDIGRWTPFTEAGLKIVTNGSEKSDPETLFFGRIVIEGPAIDRLRDLVGGSTHPGKDITVFALGSQMLGQYLGLQTVPPTDEDDLRQKRTFESPLARGLSGYFEYDLRTIRKPSKPPEISERLKMAFCSETKDWGLKLDEKLKILWDLAVSLSAPLEVARLESRQSEYAESLRTRYPSELLRELLDST